ncbi:MAG: hypothetical protein ACOYIF_11105 [Acetivibrionales bacterium]|jgi:hypothetical protein
MSVMFLEEANQMDIITEAAIRDFGYDEIQKMTNDHLDSIACAFLHLKIMEKLNAKTIVKWDHKNSDEVGNTITGNTTSYFSFGFFSR